MLPDFHPKYRAMSHYPDISLEYIVSELNYLIFLGRYIDFKNDFFYGISNKFFSRKLGIISHFLADFVCLPHYEKWTFNDSLIKHVKYEKNIAKFATDFDFRSIDIGEIEFVTDKNGNYQISDIIRNFINEVLVNYSQDRSMTRDLDFSYNINLMLTEFVLETIKLYNDEVAMERAIVF